MSRTIVLVGPHAAGKTTLGRSLARHLGWTFHEELGRKLREQALQADPDAHAARSQEDFDRMVIQAELDRDQEWNDQEDRVVETWHPGNMAYACCRSREVARDMEVQVLWAMGRHVQVLVQPVLVRPATIRMRLSEPGPVDDLVAFFGAVAEAAMALARRWGLPLLEPVWTDRISEEEALSALVQNLGRRLP